MTPITQTIPNPFGGISQQPPIARSPSQAESMINMDPDVVEGIRRRFPTILVKETAVSGSDPFGAFVYVFPKAMTGGVEYVLVSYQGNFQIINAETGADVGISGGTANAGSPSVLSYIAPASPGRHLGAVSISDTTLVFNRNVTVTSTVHGSAPSATDVFSSFEDLPATGNASTLYRIQTKNGARDAYYFVRWDAGLQAYVETFRGPLKRPNQDTMPLALSYVSLNQFRLDYPDWKAQEVGDETVVPVPSFYGATIRDVFFYRNRLALLTNNSIVMSRSGRYYDFYPKTVTEVFADDPVDVSAANTNGSLFRYAVPFDSSVLIFGDKAQFQFNFNGSIEQSIPTLDPMTEYECADVRPARIGPNVYFAQKSPAGIRIREYYTRENAVTNDALDVTEHCPNYVKASAPTDLVSIPGNDMLVVNDSATRTKLTYGPSLKVMRARWDQEGRRVQTAWFEWNFGIDRVLDNEDALCSTMGIAVGDSTLYMLQKQPSGFGMLVKMFLGKDLYEANGYTVVSSEPDSLAGGPTPQGKWIPALDFMRASISGSYDSVNDRTTLSFSAQQTSPYFRNTAVSTKTGEQYSFQFNFVPENQTNNMPFLVGLPYDSELTLSQIFLRDNEGRPNTGGRLKLKHIRALLKDTGACLMIVASFGREAKERLYSGYELTPFSMLGAAMIYLRDRWIKFSLNSDSERTSITFKSVGLLPLTITAIEWTGAFFRRGSRR